MYLWVFQHFPASQVRQQYRVALATSHPQASFDFVFVCPKTMRPGLRTTRTWCQGGGTSRSCSCWQEQLMDINESML
jgi:hypothetical protein